MATGIDVLVVGGCGVDTIVRVAELAVPAGDYLPVGPIRDYVGHPGTGAALGLRALGRSTVFLDLMGEDAQGELIRTRYRDAGLEFAWLPAPDGTPRSVLLVDAQGRRFSFFDGRHPQGLALPREFYLPYLRQARHVHVSGQGVAGSLLADARAAGVSVSTDVHAWDGEALWAREFALGADLTFVSAATIGSAQAPALLRKILTEGRARVAVATDGGNGCFVADRGQREVRHFPAVVPAGKVVDSNGAGDAFATAFTDAWLDHGDVELAARAGLLSGAFACTHHGTHERLMTRAELDSALHTAPIG